jgi:hypothetical protein
MVVKGGKDSRASDGNLCPLYFIFFLPTKISFTLTEQNELYTKNEEKKTIFPNKHKIIDFPFSQPFRKKRIKYFAIFSSSSVVQSHLRRHILFMPFVGKTFCRALYKVSPFVK